jgi:hypothetical protein
MSAMYWYVYIGACYGNTFALCSIFFRFPVAAGTFRMQRTYQESIFCYGLHVSSVIEVVTLILNLNTVSLFSLLSAVLSCNGSFLNIGWCPTHVKLLFKAYSMCLNASQLLLRLICTHIISWFCFKHACELSPWTCFFGWLQQYYRLH